MAVALSLLDAGNVSVPSGAMDTGGWPTSAGRELS